MEVLIQKLSSRKFLLAVAAFLTSVSQGQPLAAAAVAGIYVLAEAAVDRAAA